MTIEEAIHCMKSYLPDQGEYYRCFRCPYYGSKQIDHRDNSYTCQSSLAHTMAIEALEKMLQDQRSKEEEHIQYLKSQKEFVEKEDGGFIFRWETDPPPSTYEQIYNFIRQPDVEFYDPEEKAKIFKLLDEIAEEDRDKLKVKSGPTVAADIYPAQDLITTGVIANGKHFSFRMIITNAYYNSTQIKDYFVKKPDYWEVTRCSIWEVKE